jgi:pSer/pThr/pTyr-binding forkhead associated (FHA) protein
MLKLRFVNKEHGDVWLVEPSVLIGADPGCQVVLKQTGIKPRHAEIQIKGNQLVLVNLANDASTTVNGKACDKQSNLATGDQIMISGIAVLLVDPKDERKAAPAAVAPTSSGWAIRANHGALGNKVYSINGDTVLGRAAECDLSFSVAHMSRKHASLSILNGQLMVKDLDSANGTFVNGAPVQEAKLQKGDELRLDTLSFTVIGPGGDSDKTTVRAAISPVQAAVKMTPAALSTERERKRAAGTTIFQKAVAASEDAKQEAERSGVNLALAAVALLATLVIIAYIVVA